MLAAARYIVFNPVRAVLAKKPDDSTWSSASPHLSGKDDNPVNVSALPEVVGDWRAFLSEEIPEEDANALRRHERIGRPLGNEHFISRMEGRLGRVLRRQKPGTKKKSG